MSFKIYWQFCLQPPAQTQTVLQAALQGLQYEELISQLEITLNTHVKERNQIQMRTFRPSMLCPAPSDIRINELDRKIAEAS